MTDNLRSVVMQAIGQASMCWEFPERAGVFQSDQAIKVAEKLIEEINSVLKPVTGGSNADGTPKMPMSYNEEGYMTLQNENRKLNLVRCSRCGEFHATDKGCNVRSGHIAPVVRSNATQTTKYFWNCECERDYIHPRNTGFCDKCKTRREYQPNSRIDEVVKIMIAKG